MDKNYTSTKTFEKENFSETAIAKGEYEDCTFRQCIFSNGDLSAVQFVNCQFIACDLTLARVFGTAMREVRFKDCKLMGIHFEHCNEFLFSIDLENCIVNHSSFYQRSLKKMRFKNCNLQETDFTQADLTSAVFDGSDLLNAKFENTILEKADFRTAINYSIDPSANRIKKARFALPGVLGLLDQYDIVID